VRRSWTPYHDRRVLAQQCCRQRRLNFALNLCHCRGYELAKATICSRRGFNMSKNTDFSHRGLGYQWRRTVQTSASQLVEQLRCDLTVDEDTCTSAKCLNDGSTWAIYTADYRPFAALYETEYHCCALVVLNGLLGKVSHFFLVFVRSCVIKYVFSVYRVGLLFIRFHYVKFCVC